MSKQIKKTNILKHILNILLFPFFGIEKVLYFVRNAMWEYPNFFTEKNALIRYLVFLFRTTQPIGNFVLSLVLMFSIIFFVMQGSITTLLGISRGKVLKEGIVMGFDNLGFVQKISKVDPFMPANIQFEKDIVELIYEPLIKFEFIQKEDGSWGESIKKVLAKEVFEIRPGADYRFDLKENVYWHDGKPFTADDVIHTFNLVSRMEKSNSSYTLALKQLQWEKITDYSIRVCTQNKDFPTTCSNSKDNPILSNFLELISVKIVPKHLTLDLNPNTYVNLVHPILIYPVGTGRFKFSYVDQDGIKLTVNTVYHDLSKLVNIKEIEGIYFKYFGSFEDAISALLSGNIHSLVSFTTEFFDDIQQYSYIQRNFSSVIYNQYWSLYFNLNEEEDTDHPNKVFLQDQRMRRAIAHAINREEIIEVALRGMGEEAFGPINKHSIYFNEEANWPIFDINKSKQILEEIGWTVKDNSKYRTNDEGKILEFNLYFLDTYDRKKIAYVIKDNLEKVGIKLNLPVDVNNQIKGFSLDDLTNQVIANKKFDILLFGINTFIDPDRYELFHSSQSKFPGLNIASYESSEKSVIPNPNRQSPNDKSVITIPKVDKLLDQARRFDPKIGLEKRKQDYFDIQEIIAMDSPVVFLFHPKFLYYTNRVVKNVDMTNVTSQEDRFRNIHTWKIKI